MNSSLLSFLNKISGRQSMLQTLCILMLLWNQCIYTLDVIRQFPSCYHTQHFKMLLYTIYQQAVKFRILQTKESSDCALPQLSFFSIYHYDTFQNILCILNNELTKYHFIHLMHFQKKSHPYSVLFKVGNLTTQIRNTTLT